MALTLVATHGATTANSEFFDRLCTATVVRFRLKLNIRRR
jgi:hypothetical protein